MNRLAVVGAGGHGVVVADAAVRAGWREIVFFDDGPPPSRPLGGWACAGPVERLRARAGEFDGAVVGIGDNAARLKNHDLLAAAGLTLVTIVHPSAAVSTLAELGAGTVVFACGVVNPFARLGRSCIVNTAASVDHDCTLEDGIHVSPGAHLGGGVRVGRESWIGIGAAVRPGVSIGAQVMVAGGAMVIADVTDGMRVAGVPARRLVC